MNIIDSPAALDLPIDPNLRRLLTTRRDQLAGADAARFLVVDHTDTVASVEAALGFPLVTSDDGEAVPCWEWAETHPGGWTELCFVLSDDGPADVLLVPDHEGVAPDLTALLNLHADQHACAPAR